MKTSLNYSFFLSHMSKRCSLALLQYFQTLSARICIGNIRNQNREGENGHLFGKNHCVQAPRDKNTCILGRCISTEKEIKNCVTA